MKRAYYFKKNAVTPSKANHGGLSKYRSGAWYFMDAKPPLSQMV